MENRYRILAAIMLGGIMGPIDASIVNVILPTIADYFGASLATTQWVPLIYLLTISSLLLFYGRLADIIGYRRIYLVGLASFTIASGLCGLAPTIHWLIIFRALQGVSAGMVMSVPFAILTAVFQPHERGRALGINAISISAGLALGPTLGGLLVLFWSWRLVFLINIPVGLVGLWWANRVLPDLKGEGGHMDYVGALSIFVGLFSFLFFINHLQTKGFGLVTGLALGISIMAGGYFFYIERRLPQPLIDFALFKNRVFTLGILSAMLNYASQYILVFLTPFYLQRVLHFTPEKIGFLMTSFPLAVMLVAPFSGAISDKLGSRELAMVGSALCAIALAMMAFLPVASSVPQVASRLFVFGLGTGIFQSPNNSAVMGSVPRHYLGISSGVLATVRNTGMALGIAMAGLVLYSLVPPLVMAQDYLGSVEALQFLGGLKYAYLLGGVFSAFAAIFSFMQVKPSTPNLG